MMRASSATIALLLLAASGCDDRQTWHRPEPALERMLQQRRADPYAESAVFADGRSMRAPPPDTIARSAAFVGDVPARTGRDANGYLSQVPLPVSRALLELGRRSFDDVCATCHGVLGDGVSVVAEKMQQRKPPSLFEPRLAVAPPGKLFEVASRGYGLMPGYASTLGVEERWAIVSYIEVLRLRRAVKVEALPAEMRDALAKGSR